MRTSLSLFGNGLRSIGRHEGGAVAIVVALAAPILAGMTGLAVDVGSWYFAKRDLQTAADAAAMAAGAQMANGQSLASMESAALTDAQTNGFDAASGTLALSTPPTAGGYVGDPGAVEVTLRDVAPLYFSSLFISDGVTLEARAVAKVFVQADMCMVALDDSAGPALTVSGSVSIDMGCGMAANSTAINALSVAGGVNLTASALWTMGGIEEIGGAGLIDVRYRYEKASAIEDPYAGLAVPAYAGCDQTNYRLNNGSATLSPGVYCGGITLGANADVTLAPGTYIIDGGDLDVGGHANLVGDGVTLVMTSSSGADYGSAKLTGTGTVRLSAPTNGAMAGVVIYADRAGAGGSASIGGTADGDLEGVIYLPTQSLTMHGTGTVHDGCMKIIANTIDVVGDVGLTNDCSLTATKEVVTLRVRLVE